MTKNVIILHYNLLRGSVGVDKRISGIDILKIIASFFVILLHTQVRSIDFNALKVEPTSKFIMTLFVRYTVMSSIGIFLMITGYFQYKKKFTKSHYIKLIPIILTYLIISVIGEIILSNNGYSDRTFWKATEAVLDFTADGYAWYVEMFVGLYLIIPFINLAYNGLESRRNKKFFIFILLLLTVLPTVSETFIKNMILSDYWLICYPVAFYAIGAYINEYKIKLNSFFLFFIGFIFIALTVFLQFIFNIDGKYSPFVMHGFNCLTSLVVSLTLFLIFYYRDVKNRVLKTILKKTAECSLGIYLISYYAEIPVYNLITPESTLHDVILLRAVCVFLLSFAIAFIVNETVKFLTKNLIK